MLTVQHGEEKRVRSGTMERSSPVKKIDYPSQYLTFKEF